MTRMEMENGDKHSNEIIARANVVRNTTKATVTAIVDTTNYLLAEAHRLESIIKNARAEEAERREDEQFYKAYLKQLAAEENDAS